MFGTFSCLQPGRNVVSRQISQTEFIHICFLVMLRQKRKRVSLKDQLRMYALVLSIGGLAE